MTVYKIRRRSDGLYSEAGSGGPWVRFSKIGKTWNHLRHVVMHIESTETYSRYFNKLNPYTGTSDIIEFDLVERGVVIPKPKRVQKRTKPLKV